MPECCSLHTHSNVWFTEEWIYTFLRMFATTLFAHECMYMPYSKIVFPLYICISTIWYDSRCIGDIVIVVGFFFFRFFCVRFCFFVGSAFSLPIAFLLCCSSVLLEHCSDIFFPRLTWWCIQSFHLFFRTEIDPPFSSCVSLSSNSGSCKSFQSNHGGS